MLPYCFMVVLFLIEDHFRTYIAHLMMPSHADKMLGNMTSNSCQSCQTANKQQYFVRNIKYIFS